MIVKTLKESFDKHHHKKKLTTSKNVKELFVIVMPALKLLSE